MYAPRMLKKKKKSQAKYTNHYQLIANTKSNEGNG